MINYDGQKYACVNCIRGHRSSSCDHTDRVLLQVRRRGRRAGKGHRIAMIPKRENTASPLQPQGKFSPRDYSMVEFKSEEDSRDTSTPVDDEIVFTDKYIFIPVGDGLYRREYREQHESQRINDLQSKSLVETPCSSIDPALASSSAPMVIAPMNFDPSSLQIENQDLWPENFELTYAPQCVIPGKCECGDGCQCPDCWEHSTSHGHSVNL